MFSKNQYEKYMHMPIEELNNLADSGSDVAAQYMYGYKLFFEISGFNKDIEDTGVEYIRRAAENGWADAEHWIAMEYLDLSPDAQASEEQEKGISFLKSASLKGHFEAAIALGYVYFTEGPMHSFDKAVSVWTEACDQNKASAKTDYPHYTAVLFCNRLSNLFSEGVYGAPKQNALSSDLHILGNNHFVSAQKQKGILLFLSELEFEQPEFFEKLQTAGLQWPDAEVLEELIVTADQKRMSPDPIGDPKARRISVCNSLLWVRSQNASLAEELAMYIKGKLPTAIANIPNLKPALGG